MKSFAATVHQAFQEVLRLRESYSNGFDVNWGRAG